MLPPILAQMITIASELERIAHIAAHMAIAKKILCIAVTQALSEALGKHAQDLCA